MYTAFEERSIRNCFAIDSNPPSVSPPYGALAGRTSKPAEHDTAHRRVDHSHRGLRQTLVVLSQPTRLPQPCEGPLYHPPARQHPETPRLLLEPVPPQLPIGVVGHLHAPSPFLAYPLSKPAGVGGIRPDDGQPRQFPLQLMAQELPTAVAVVQAGCVDVHAEHEASSVHQQVTLASGQTLSTIVAAFGTADAGSPHHLAVQDRPARIAILALRFAHRRPEPVVGLPQPLISPPLAKVVVDRLPGRVLLREHPPGAAAPQQVKDGVGYAPGRPLRGTAAPFRGR